MRSLLIYFLIISSTTLAQDSAKKEILSIMEDQEQCWNKGDIDCFMEGYWKSDSLKFIGSKGITYGWEPTLANYKEKYNSTEKMGQLKFDVLEVEKLSATSYFVVGKWHLTRKMGDVGGHFSLIWRKINSKWKIVADHSS